MNTEFGFYTPRPGSVADRLIACLQALEPPGDELSTARLAERTGVPVGSINASLQPALDACALYARKKGGHVRSPLFWSVRDHTKNGCAGEATSPANGSQKPDGDAAIPPARAGRETPPKGANRDASTEQSHGAAGSESPPGRGDNVAPALGAAPAFTPAAAGPSGDFRCALFSDGELRIEWRGQIIELEPECTRELVAYLDRLAPGATA